MYGIQRLVRRVSIVRSSSVDPSCCCFLKLQTLAIVLLLFEKSFTTKEICIMAQHGFSCFCWNLRSLPSIEKKIINFYQLQTVVGKTSIDGRKCRFKQKQLKLWWAIVRWSLDSYGWLWILIRLFLQHCLQGEGVFKL